ncbi:MAG: adenosylcobinamide-GDP ribazoletransferase [Eubacterium sp.]|nr:adenosylcobinamide-GDP ribazoletransferase [Eubacterium sp.]
MARCLSGIGVLIFPLANYYVRCRRELGGITGDTAGYFVLLCELCIVITEAAYQIFCG